MKGLFVFVFIFYAAVLNAQIVSTIAGTGFPVSTGDGGLAILAGVNTPGGGVFDKIGNYYFADGYSNKIRKINTAGIISTVAGNGMGGFLGDGGAATTARLNNPQAVRLDTSGNLYIADAANNRIRRVDAMTGIISTIAGTGVGGYNSDGIMATLAQIWNPQDVAVDTFGNIYIVDMFNYRVRKVDAFGIISTVAGTGVSGFTGDGLPATSAQLGYPTGLALDDTGNLYIADPSSFACRVRKINTSGIITTVAGNGSSGYTGDGVPANSASLVPLKVELDILNNLYIADRYNDRVYKVDGFGILHHIAGDGIEGDSGDGGPGTLASLFNPTGVAIDACGNVYIPTVGHVSVPGGGCRIRKVTYSAIGSPSTVSMSPTPNDTVCAGTSVTYTTSVSGGTPLGYQWYVNGAAIAGATNDTYAYTPADMDSVRCVVVVGASCNYVSTSSNTIDMVVNPIIVPTVNVAPMPNDTVCAGTSVTFNSSITGPGTADAYQWYVNGVPVGTGSSYAYIPSNGDSVRCAYTSTSTCGGTVTINGNMIDMVVDPIIVPSVNVTPLPNDTVCAGTVVTFNPTITGGGMGASYLWYVNGVPVGTGSSYAYIPSNGDSIRCACTSTSTCGGTVTINSNMTNMVVTPVVIPTVAITVSPDDTVCSGTPVTISATISGGSALAYTWYKNGTIMSATGSTHTYVPANGDSVRCVVNSMESCTGTPLTISSNTINMVLPTTTVPVIAITGITSASAGSIVTVNATVSGASAYTIKWINKGTLFNTTTVPLVTYTKAAGTDTITARVIPTGAVCYDSATSNIHLVDMKTGVDIIELSPVTIHPNPVIEYVVVGSSSVLAHVSLFDLTGRELLKVDVKEKTLNVDLTTFPAGIYILKATDILGHQTVERLVKQ